MRPLAFLLVLLATAPNAAAQGTAAQAGATKAPGAPPAAAPADQGPAPASSSAWTDIGYLAIDAGYQDANSGFAHTFSFPKYAEQATIDTHYPKRDGPVFNFAWTFRLWRNFAAGLAVAAVNAATATTSVSASIPHPVLARTPRVASGSAAIDRSETGIHLQLGYARRAGNLLLAVTGGPSYFQVKQALVDSVEVSESYRVDTVALLPIQASTKKETTIGFNVAGDAAYYFTRVMGVGLVARYSRGVVSFAVGQGSVSATAGGFQVAAGLRLRLPNKNTTKTPGQPPTKPVRPGPVRKPGK